jgi:peptidoglycan/LPS O-acetylase OafA/YrhL
MKKNIPLYTGLRRITSGQAFIPEVDFLRFIAIFAVVIYHTNSFILIKTSDNVVVGKFFDSLIRNGGLGVDLFFVLSGFILSIPFASFYFGKKLNAPNLKKYYLRRVTRLEPPYIIVMTLLFFAMIFIKHYNTVFYLKSWAASLIYMHNLLFERASYLNAVAWTLEIEVFFYLSFPLLAKLFSLKQIPRRITLFVLMFFVPFFSKLFINADFPIILDYMQFFMAGMILCDFYLNEQKIILNKYVVVLLTGIIIYIIFMTNWKEHSYIFFSIFPLLIAFFYLLVLSNSDKVTLFKNNVLVVIGGMCYSIYLIHYTIISTVGNILINKAKGINPLIFMAILLLAVLLASVIFYKLIERPFMSLKWIDKFKENKKKLPDVDKHYSRSPA